MITSVSTAYLNGYPSPYTWLVVYLRDGAECEFRCRASDRHDAKDKFRRAHGNLLIVGVYEEG